MLVPPVDAPYSRLTVLRDPQGATFSATAFVPENKDIGRRPAERPSAARHRASDTFECASCLHERGIEHRGEVAVARAADDMRRPSS